MQPDALLHVGRTATHGRGGWDVVIEVPSRWEYYASHPEDLEVSDVTFHRPDMTTFARLDESDLVAVGQHLHPDRAMLECRVMARADDASCRGCGAEGAPRGTVTRCLTHEPFGWRPITLLMRVRRYRCTSCRRVWRQDTSRAAEPRAILSRASVRWALLGLVVQRLTVAPVADALAVAWHTATDTVRAEGRRVLIDDEARFDGVAVIGVDELVWRLARLADRYGAVVTAEEQGPRPTPDSVTTP